MRIAATGGAANVTADDVEKLAKSLQGLTGIDREQIVQGENMLLQFRSVRNEVGATNDVFTRATKDAADLAVAMGTDVSAAATTLGLALQDPLAGMTRLRRAHVILTQAQKDSIAQFIAVGDILSAQKVELQAVEDQVGGAAEAYGKTLPGQLAIAKLSIEDTKAALTASLAPALVFGAKGVQFLATEFQKLPPPVQTAVGVVGLLTAGVTTLAPAVQTVVDLWGKYRAGQEAAVAAIEAATVAAADSVSASTAVAVAQDVVAVSSAALTTQQLGLALGTETAWAAEQQQLFYTDALVVSEADLAAATQVAVVTEGELAAAATSAAAAEAEAAAAAEAATVATSGLATAVAAIAAPVAIAAAAWYGLNHQTSVSVDVQKEAGASTADLVAQYDDLQTVGFAAGHSTEVYTKIAEGSLGTAMRLRSVLNAQGKDTTVLDEVIRKVSASQKQVALDTAAAADATAAETVVTDRLATALFQELDAKAKLLVAQDAARTANQAELDGTNSLLAAKDAYTAGQEKVKQAIQDATTATDDSKTAQNEVSIAVNDASTQILAQSVAATKLYTDTVAANGGIALSADQTRAVQVANLQDVANHLVPGSALFNAVEGYIGELQKVPTSHVTRFQATFPTGLSGDLFRQANVGGITTIGDEGWGGTVRGAHSFIFGGAGAGGAEDVLAAPHKYGGMRALLGQAAAYDPSGAVSAARAPAVTEGSGAAGPGWSGNLVVMVDPSKVGASNAEAFGRQAGDAAATLLRRRLYVHSRTGSRRR